MQSYIGHLPEAKLRQIMQTNGVENAATVLPGELRSAAMAHILAGRDRQHAPGGGGGGGGGGGRGDRRHAARGSP